MHEAALSAAGFAPVSKAGSKKAAKAGGGQAGAEEAAAWDAGWAPVLRCEVSGGGVGKRRRTTELSDELIHAHRQLTFVRKV